MVHCVARFRSYVERVLDRISNGQLADDRRAAMVELQSVVAESRSAQLAFGAMGMCFVCQSNFSYRNYLKFINEKYTFDMFLQDFLCS